MPHFRPISARRCLQPNLMPAGLHHKLTATPMRVPPACSWEMTERSYLHVAKVWRDAALSARSMPRHLPEAAHYRRLEAAGKRLLREARKRGQVSQAAFDEFSSRQSVT